MTPRPELSNRTITIETGPNGVRCFAKPRRMILFYVFSVLVLAFSLAMLTALAGPIRRLPNRFETVDLITVVLSVAPTIATGGLIFTVLRRMYRKRGVEIIDGTVTLHTPDSTTAMHVFDLNDLKGITLARGNSGSILRVDRRNGAKIPVLLGYPSADLTTMMDTVNSMVVDNRYHAFEVIPIAQPAPQRDGSDHPL